MSSSQTLSASERRLDGLRRLECRLELVLGQIPGDFEDWSPDSGIASIETHLRRMATAARRFRTFCSNEGTSTSRSSHAPLGVHAAELARVIEICHRASVDLLSKGCLGEDGQSDLLDQNLDSYREFMTHELSALALLMQLLDPSHVSVESLIIDPSSDR